MFDDDAFDRSNCGDPMRCTSDEFAGHREYRVVRASRKDRAFKRGISKIEGADTAFRRYGT